MPPTQQDHELTWGAIMLSQPSDAPTDAAYEIYAHSEAESNLGNPVSVIESVRSLLVDGSVAIKTGHESRTITLQLAIVADDGEALAEGEALLMTEVLAEQPAPLRWVPPAVESAPCNFDVQVADLQRGYPDWWTSVYEPRRLERFFTLTLTCLPWVRTDDPVVIPALPLPADPDVPAWTDIDTCGSLTNWTLETGSVTTVVGPQTGTFGGETVILGGGQVNSPTDFIRLVRTAAITVPADYYLALDVELDNASGGSLSGNWTLYYDGAWHPPTAIAPGLGENDSTRLFFANVETITSFKLAFDFTSVPGDRTVYVMVYNVAHTDTIGSSPDSTTRQQARFVDVQGSAPTTAALRLFTETTDLGRTVLLYSAADEAVFPPPLRTWMKAADVADAVADSALISGWYNDLDPARDFLVPAELLADGTYSLVARMKRTTGATVRSIEWEATVKSDTDTDVFGTEQVISGSTDCTFSDTSWHPFALASLTLPVIKLDDGAGYIVHLTISIDSGGGDLLLDEAWLMDTDRGAYTLLDMPSTADLSWVEVRSPELDAPLPAVFGGTGGSTLLEGQDVGRFVEAFGIHRFQPGPMLIFTACSGSKKSQSEIEFYPRFHSHVVYGAAEV